MALNKQAVLEYIFIFKYFRKNLTFIDLNYMHKNLIFHFTINSIIYKNFFIYNYI